VPLRCSENCQLKIYVRLFGVCDFRVHSSPQLAPPTEADARNIPFVHGVRVSLSNRVFALLLASATTRSFPRLD